jgi:hypothetical protein
VLTKPFYNKPFEEIERRFLTGSIYVLGILTSSYYDLGTTKEQILEELYLRNK